MLIYSQKDAILNASFIYKGNYFYKTFMGLYMFLLIGIPPFFFISYLCIYIIFSPFLFSRLNHVLALLFPPSFLYLFIFYISHMFFLWMLFDVFANFKAQKITILFELLSFYSYIFFIWFIALFSNLETCACDIPISAATSICVLPSKNLFDIIILSLSFSFFIISAIVMFSAQCSSVPFVSLI